MFKKIIAIVVLCFTFSSCERANIDFNLEEDIIGTWLLKTETVQTYVVSGDIVVANETKFNDFSNTDVYFKPFSFLADGVMSYEDYNGVTETTEWEILNDDELLVLSEQLAPEPFEEIKYKVDKLTANTLHMSSRIITEDANIKTTLRTELYFER